MRSNAFAALAALAVAAASLAPVGSVEATAAPTASPSASKDPCGDVKSKWAHYQCESYNNSAPGDEYFGRMKLSYLGIDNTFKDGAISAGGYTTDPGLIAKLMFADEALRRWAAKYPNDPQLARSYFFGEQVFRKVYTQQGQQVAWEYITILTHKFASSYFGKVMKASLAKNGFTEHWIGDAQMCPTPLPPGVVPEATPAATPTPTPAPGHPAVDVITPPCIKPTPTPTPYGMTPTPYGMTPSPSPSPSPSPKRH